MIDLLNLSFHDQQYFKKEKYFFKEKTEGFQMQINLRLKNYFQKSSKFYFPREK